MTPSAPRVREAAPNLPPGFDFTDPDIYATAAAGGGVRRGPAGGADLVERAATRRRRIRRRRLLGGQQAPRRPRGVAAQRRVLVGEEVDRAALQGDRRRRPDRGRRSVDDHDGRPRAHSVAQDHLPRVHAARRRAAARRAQRARTAHRRARPPTRAPATSSSRSPASCRCRRSPDCSAFRWRTATSCSTGPTR